MCKWWIHAFGQLPSGPNALPLKKIQEEHICTKHIFISLCNVDCNIFSPNKNANGFATPTTWGALGDLLFDLHQNVYSEVASKKLRKAIAIKYTISYQNKDFNKSNVYKDVVSQIRLQRLNLDTSVLVDIFTNIILD